MEQFAFRRAYYEALQELPADKFKTAVLAVCEYALDGAQPTLSGTSKAVFALIRDLIDMDREEKCETARTKTRERVQRYREKQKAETIDTSEKNDLSEDLCNADVTLHERYSNVTESVTPALHKRYSNVTCNAEKEREEGFPLCPPSSSPPVTPVSPTPYNPPSSEEKERVLRAKRFTPPTLAEVQSYVAERHSAVDPQEFIDFYTSKGWMVGKTPMKDWKAACRNAEKWDRWRGITPREEDRYGRYTGYSGQNQSTPRRIPGELVLE